jgi:hypothetical protein
MALVVAAVMEQMPMKEEVWVDQELVETALIIYQMPLQVSVDPEAVVVVLPQVHVQVVVVAMVW